MESLRDRGAVVTGGGDIGQVDPAVIAEMLLSAIVGNRLGVITQYEALEQYEALARIRRPHQRIERAVLERKPHRS